MNAPFSSLIHHLSHPTPPAKFTESATITTSSGRPQNHRPRTGTNPRIPMTGIKQFAGNLLRLLHLLWQMLGRGCTVPTNSKEKKLFREQLPGPATSAFEFNFSLHPSPLAKHSYAKNVRLRTHPNPSDLPKSRPPILAIRLKVNKFNISNFQFPTSNFQLPISNFQHLRAATGFGVCPLVSASPFAASPPKSDFRQPQG